MEDSREISQLEEGCIISLSSSRSGSNILNLARHSISLLRGWVMQKRTFRVRKVAKEGRPAGQSCKSPKLCRIHWGSQPAFLLWCMVHAVAKRGNQICKRQIIVSQSIWEPDRQTKHHIIQHDESYLSLKFTKTCSERDVYFDDERMHFVKLGLIL